MSEAENTPSFKLSRLIIPILIGVSASAYLIITNFHPSALARVELSGKLFLGLSLAALIIVIRGFAFMFKLRLSTGNRLSWYKTFETVVMWEFSAAVTPKLSEGAFVLYILKKSGLSYGRSTAVLMLNSFLDNLSFVLVFSILYYIIGHQMLVLPGYCPDLAGHEILQGIRSLADKAWIGYVLMFSLCLFLAFSLFILPHSAKRFFHQIARLSFLKRFSKGLIHLGDEIENTSREYKNEPIGFWIKIFFATLLNWSARYILPAALFFAFAQEAVPVLEVFARQYVLWIFLVIPATPGASGLAEISFLALNCDFMPVGLGVAIALIWRIYTYYIYLLLGLIMLPKWANGLNRNI
ncbi:MAG: flippase-like domain-containing protein [Bacteroidetes bacterium]|nr:flippase-like domain-containing protein [Bacteroidota bacterium]